MNLKKSKSGFTLLEVILYSFMAALILSTVTVFLGTILASQIKNQTIAEVEQQGVQIMQIMTQSLRNAKTINSPPQGTASSTLSINGLDAAANPATFNLAGDVITMREGANPEIPLTSGRISASNLTFQNLSRAATPGSVRISFTLSRINASGRNEYDFTKTFITSASLR
jgi:hypothetical protein